MKKQEKSENRKALPKFLLTIIIAALVGCVIGAAMGFLGGTRAPEAVVTAIYQGLSVITPYAIWVVTLVLVTASLVLYRQAKAIFRSWDGETEEIMDRAEEKLSWMLLLTSLNMILSFLFFGLAFVLENTLGPVILIGFIVSLAAVVILQQKAVDLTKKMNPEKRGSVYDMKFQKKWMDSCDENEQRMIGRAARKAFTAVNGLCAVLWMLLALLSIILPLGILPVFLVTLIWGVCQMVYMAEAIRLERHK